MRKGWCPGALRPMEAKDGLLVRLRITNGIIASTHARAIAGLAQRFGNGRLDLSARGNLQLRGVTGESWPALVDGLRALALIDDDPAAEAVRNVVASPLAGLHDGLDIRPLVRAIEAELVTDPDLRRLPAKFSFLVDDGTQPSLASLTADIRFDWLPQAGVFSVGLGGTRGGALRIGTCGPEALVDHAGRAALGAIALLWEDEAPRRMRGLIDALGGDAVAAACGGTMQDALAGSLATPKLAGVRRFHDRPVLGLAAPFGRLDAGMLRHAAELAGELRLTPWRTILLPGVDPGIAELAALRRRGFIVDAENPRLDVIACVGQDGCASGTTSTHADAALLADLVHAAGSTLHVSGCRKGCARAEPTPITLVGRDGLYDLVYHGRAGDPPALRGLDLAAVRADLAASWAA